MSTVPDHIQIKLQDALAYYSKINETCLDYIDSPNQKKLKRISVYIGEQSQALRSSLNNSMWDFCEKVLQNSLSKGEYNKIKWSHDFPIESDNSSFINSRCRALRHIAKDFLTLYQFLEAAQPYNKGNEYLYQIKILSNDTSHTIPIDVQDGQIDMMYLFGYQPPVIRGNEVTVQWVSGGMVAKYLIPCYVDEMKMYISKDQKWKTFWMSIDGGNTLFSPTPFSKSVPSFVEKLINEFYSLW